MTLPSRRKLPITRPNTPTFVSRAGGALVSMTLAALCAVPLYGAERTRETAPSDSPFPAGLRGGHSPWTESAEPAEPADDVAVPPLRKAAPAKSPATKNSVARTATAKAAPRAQGTRKARKKPARAIRPAAYQQITDGAETASATTPAADDILQTNKRFTDSDDRTTSLPQWPHSVGASAVEELAPSHSPASDAVEKLAQNSALEPTPESADDVDSRRARLRDQLTRPFKQMKAIRPYYDYEPDSEQLASDRCFNLCPRPGSPDCPECQNPDANGNPQGGMTCPDCPLEIDLRDTARLVGSINDFPVRSFPHLNYCWEPTNLYSYPLYFEDHCLERYGHTRHFLIQPAFSVGLFCAQFVGLPYQMTIDPVAKKRYALGWYRPGQYVPYKYYQVPWNTEAALVEAGVIAGSYFLFAPGVGP